MDWAPCLYCGERKASALVGCEACGEVPRGRAAAEHLLAGELPEAERQAVATRRQAGEAVTWPTAEVEAMERHLAAASGPRVALFALGVLALPFLTIVAALLLVAAGILSL